MYVYILKEYIYMGTAHSPRGSLCEATTSGAGGLNGDDVDHGFRITIGPRGAKLIVKE